MTDQPAFLATIAEAAPLATEAAKGLPEQEEGQDGTIGFLASCLDEAVHWYGQSDDEEYFEQLCHLASEAARHGLRCAQAAHPVTEARAKPLLQVASLLNRAAAEMLG